MKRIENMDLRVLTKHEITTINSFRAEHEAMFLGSNILFVIHVFIHETSTIKVARETRISLQANICKLPK